MGKKREAMLAQSRLQHGFAVEGLIDAILLEVGLGIEGTPGSTVIREAVAEACAVMGTTTKDFIADFVVRYPFPESG